MDKIYLDNAATTPLSEEVIDAMVDVMKVNFGNPSSTHSFGQEAKILIENVRREVADYLHVTPAEIIFTSCGTESNNMIIKSCVNHLGVERIITSPMEHKCVAETVLDMKKRRGVEVVYLRPDQKGDFDLNKLEELLKNSEKKTLVSLMHANNEIGNLIDLKKVAEICKENKALFHSDTVQSMAHMKLDFSEIPLDFASREVISPLLFFSNFKTKSFLLTKSPHIISLSFLFVFILLYTHKKDKFFKIFL